MTSYCHARCRRVLASWRPSRPRGRAREPRRWRRTPRARRPDVGGARGLIQAAQWGLLCQGVPFRGFAYYRIRLLIYHARRLDRPGRKTAGAVRALETTQSLLGCVSHCKILARRLRLDLERGCSRAPAIGKLVRQPRQWSHALVSELAHKPPRDMAANATCGCSWAVSALTLISCELLRGRNIQMRPVT